MRIKVLGCSGGIGGSLRTTSFLIDDDVLMDAGTGVGDLSLEQLARIDHVFLTHSHLDHIAALPLMIDTVGAMREKPVTVYATGETLKILRDHVFNWKVWPDFTIIPDASEPYMAFREIPIGETVEIFANSIRRRFTPIPAVHTVPAVGYLLQSDHGALIFSGDTGENDALWQVANTTPNLRYLIIETAFSNKERAIADASKHLCPDMLASELAKLSSKPEILITHLKPGEGALTMREVLESAGRWRPKMLETNLELQF
jgi:ribonuclease BN (tRNA processing enzyme)